LVGTARKGVPTILVSESADGMVGTLPDACASVGFAHPTGSAFALSAAMG
jgi:hypothetical protein